MKSNHILVDGKLVEVVETTGSGIPIFLIHGNSGSIASFNNILESELAIKYHLVAVSLPNHGNSGEDSTEIVSIKLIGDFISKIIDYFNFPEYLVLGMSLGGHAVLEVLPYFKNICGLILASSPPIEKNSLGSAFLPDPSKGLLFKDSLTESEVEFLAGCFLHGNDPSDLRRIASGIRRTKGNFRSKLGFSLQQGLIENEIEKLKCFSLPTLLLGGKNDKFLNHNYYIQFNDCENNKFVEIFNECGHAVFMEALPESIRSINDFIEKHI
jgi:pimeloyl-ACP methyl ester carboxylesterase